jgi:hypothetical protein
MGRYTDNHYFVQHIQPLTHRRGWLLLPLGRLELLRRHLGRIHRDSGEAWLMHRVAFHDQRVVGLLHRVPHFIPLFLLNENHVVRWRAWQRRQALRQRRRFRAAKCHDNHPLTFDHLIWTAYHGDFHSACLSCVCQ